MRHLKLESLARLVDEKGSPEEMERLRECAASRTELAALKEQTAALGDLPDIVAPPGDWPALAARLRSAGLLEEDAGPRRRRVLGGAPWRWREIPAWSAAAAALVVFFGGALAGARFAPGGPATTEAVADDAARISALSTPEQAFEELRRTEALHVAVRARAEELARERNGFAPAFDPYRRYAALEHLAAVSQAAVRQAPGDPYFNGLLVSVMGEREATARLVSSSRGVY